MNHLKTETKRNNRISPIQVIRVAIQLVAFLLIPGLFISVFSSIGAIYTAIIGGTFVFSEQVGNILLVAAVFLITALWGRFFCGFICSFGAMQDLLWRLGKHIVNRPLIPEKADRVLKYLKYAVLLFIVIGVWTLGVGEGVLWSPWTIFGMYSSPFKGFPTEWMFLSLGGAFLLLTVIGSLFIERFFCKYICPLGALFAIASRFRVFRIKKPSDHCGSCKLCTKKCSMSIPLYRHDEVRSGECIDCMQCTSACYRHNVTMPTVPAISGTLAAAALTGVTFMGTLPKSDTAQTTQNTSFTPAAVISTEAAGKYKNGTYTGSAAGYRGTVEVAVKVSSGYISDIDVTSYRDDREFFSRAQDQVIPAIIESQDTDVDTVSGATYSSLGIINAVEDALQSQIIAESIEAQTEAPSQAITEEPMEIIDETVTEDQDTAQDNDGYEDNSDDEDISDSNSQNNNQSGLTDGVYYGSGSGFRGTTEVAVTVEGGVITDITVTSYQDDYQFFSRAQSGVIDAILSAQSVDVSSVSGATFSSNSIKAAVADALGLSYTNPNSSMGGKHR